MIKNLIILSAELIDQELQMYFGKMPSCMIPFNGRPAIDYIYHENCNHYEKIYLLVSKQAFLVKKHIDHSQNNIEIVYIEKSNKLIDSLLQMLKVIYNKGETTIIFGDTYLPYMSSLFNNKNTIVYSRSFESARWTVCELNNGKIEFIDKKNLRKTKQHNIVIGVFNITNPKQLLEIIETNGTSKLGFYDALKDYYNQNDFQIVETHQWVDYGHVDKYFEQKNNVASRHFNNVKIDLLEMSVMKTSTDNNKLLKEINWLINLPEKLKDLTPKIYDYSLDKNNAYVKMEYFNYLTLHEAFVFGNLPINKWKIILSQLKDIINRFKYYQIDLNVIEVRSNMKEMYLTKTIERLEIFRKQGLYDFSKPIIINRIQHESLDNLITYLQSIIEDELLFEDNKFHIIHGDFCFSNILYNPNNAEIKLIDPRGIFGNIEIFGDQLYEWAKLSHSIEGLYDFIISDKYSLVKNQNSISYKTHHNELHEQIKDCFYSEIISSQDIKKVKIIQSLLFFSMLPLHNDHSSRQSIMLCKALELISPYIKKQI